MAREPGIGFWISVSGVDEQETFNYMLESNLRIEGRSEAEVAALTAELARGFAIASRGGSFADYVAATERLRHDPFMLRFTGGSPRSTRRRSPSSTAFAAVRHTHARDDVG